MDNVDGLDVGGHSLANNMRYCLADTRARHPRLLRWCALAALSKVALPFLAIYLPKSVIDGVTGGASAAVLCATVLRFTMGMALLAALEKLMEGLISHHRFKMSAYYVKKIADKGMTTDYRNVEKERFRKLQLESFAACNGHYSDMMRLYDALVAFGSSALGFVVYLGVLSRLNWLIVLMLAATTLAGYAFNKRALGWAAKHNGEKLGYQQRTGYLNTVASDVKSGKDIRLYAMPSWFNNLYNASVAGLAGWYKRYAGRVLGASALDLGLAALREGVAYAYLIYLALTGSLGAADFALYFGALTGFSLWLSGLLGQLNALNRISLSVDHLRAYLDYPEEYRREGGLEPPTGGPAAIALENVSYRYEGAEADALKNINLTVAPGERLAVVGLNGAGKTTLSKLICGLIDPTSGRVRYGGTDVREYNREGYYRRFSAVFQQYGIMPVTIEEIVAERASGELDAGRVEECLRRAGLWQAVAALPNGGRSNYGKAIYDDGVDFSGGELQKLLLARALYKGAPVVLLDEPTAALDPIAESRLYETYGEIMAESTVVFISHRLASTRFCDRIVLIENGEIAEEGTHETLLARGGRYRELFETQAKYYRENPSGGEAEA